MKFSIFHLSLLLMPDKKLESLIYNFLSLQRRIITPVHIHNNFLEEKKSAASNALWDTGASISAITPRLVKDLCLIPAGTVSIRGVTGSKDVEFVLVTIELPFGILRNNLKMAICDFSDDIGIILGMDIITLGDFKLLHGNDRTIFSFTSPPKNTLEAL